MRTGPPKVSLALLLYVVALALFALIGVGIVPENPWRMRLLAWAFFCWMLSEALWF